MESSTLLASGERIRERIPDRDCAPLITFVSLLYVLVTVLESVLVSLFSIPSLSAIELTTALPIPLVLVTGPAALWGVPLGYVLSDVASGAAEAGTFVGAGAHLYLGYSASKVARWFAIDTPVSASRFARRTAFVPFLLVVGVSAAGAAAIAGWGSEIVHRAPFFVATPSAFAEFFAVNLVSTLPLVYLFRTVTYAGAPLFDVSWPESRELSGQFDLRRVVLVTLAWTFLGTVGSVGYRTFERIPPGYFMSQNAGFVLLLDRPDLFGPGAGRVQVLFGAALLSVLVGAFFGGTRGRGGDAR